MDSPLALYRRYRPETFAEVIGQDHVTAPLRAALANNRVNHAYLFSGPRGCGKTTSARILARALNCEKAPIADPCGECRSCRDLARGGSGSIDVIEIDAASHGGVDDARDLREKAFFAPVASTYKVYIIDEAHMVSTQGFNALLKLVEEPPPHLRFIFATTEPDKVLPTIRSRTHHYPFRLIPPRLLSSYLTELCQKENVAIEPAALPLVVRAGGGSARDTLSVLDQLLGGAGADGVTHALAAGLLGYTPDSLLDDVVDAFAAGDGGGVFGVVDKVIETGQDPRRFAEDLLRRLRDLVIIAAVPDAPATGLIDVSEGQAERMTAQAARFGAADLNRAAELLATGLTDMRGATAPRLLLELICARVLLPGADHSHAGVQARLDRLERRAGVAASSPRPADEAPAEAIVEERGAPVEERRPEPAPKSQRSESGAGAGSTTGDGAPGAPVVEPRAAGATTPTAAAETAETAEIAEPATLSKPTGAAEPAQKPQTAGALSLADVRRLWPDIVEATKSRRRVTWIHLTQHAQVVAVDGTVLTLGFANPGAKDSFVAGGSDEIVRQAAIEVIGSDWKIEAIVDPGASGGQAPPSDPAGTPRPTTAARSAQPEPASAPPAPESATEVRPAGPTTWSAPSGPDADAVADRDDPDAEGPELTGTELLQRELGAQVIDTSQ
ncbi:MAG: DNA polymerase III subunit gamma and tau [Nocardioides sp.]